MEDSSKTSGGDDYSEDLLFLRMLESNLRNEIDVDTFVNEPLNHDDEPTNFNINNNSGVDDGIEIKECYNDTSGNTTTTSTTAKKQRRSSSDSGRISQSSSSTTQKPLVMLNGGNHLDGNGSSSSILSSQNDLLNKINLETKRVKQRRGSNNNNKVTLESDELQALIELAVVSAVKQEREERELLLKREREERKEQIQALQKTMVVMSQQQQSHQSWNNRPGTEEEVTALMLHHHDNKKESLETSTEIMEFMEEDDVEPHNNDDDDEWHAPFGETIYTFLYLCHARTQEFWYSVVIYLLQIGTISLTLADALDPESTTNPLQIPPMVPQEVTYAQALVVILLFAWQQDIIEGVVKFGEKYYPLGDRYPGATYLAWIGSCAAQLGAGLLVCLSCFILTMQASTVIDLMLNVTALLFMSEIDDVGFYMAKNGFITNKLQKTAIAAPDILIPKCKTRNFHRRAVCFLTMSALFVGYILIKGKQLSGHFIPTNLYVQFGDSYNPTIPYYSGILASGEEWRADRREYRDRGTSNLHLAYCVAEQAWTFSEGAGGDPCHHYFAKSHETTTYNVATIPNSEWSVRDSHNRWEPFDSFSLVSRDCDPVACQGVCLDGLCQCPHDQFGLDCQFFDICQDILVDERFPSFPQVMRPLVTDKKKRLRYETFSDRFQMLKNDVKEEYVQVYNMPVYYSNRTFPANVIFFGGRRWILTTEDQLIDWEEAHKESPDIWYFREKTVKRFEEGFHAHNFTGVAFISSPVDFQTPSFQPTPIGLNWWTIKTLDEDLRTVVPDIPVDTILLCDDPPPPCQDQPETFCVNGKCDDETGKCDCDAGDNFGFYYGDRCDLVKPCYDHLMPCYGGGNCDTISGECKCVSPWHGNACLSRYACYEEKGSCKNGGECEMTSGSCGCPVDPAITGRSCEKRASCEFFGCANGGVCGLNGQCVCRPPYFGTHCEEIVVEKTQKEFFCSEDEDCVNGTCLDTGFCDCNDPSAYGPLCENKFNCISNPGHGDVSCLNGGTCNETSGVCDCLDPYFGPDCSQVPKCQENKDCWGEGFEYSNIYWGSCDVESGICQCLYGKAAGRMCEKPIFSTCLDDQDCYGATSTCYKNVCQCDTGLGGFRCESFIPGEYHERFDRFQQMFVESVELCGFDDPACCSSDDKGFWELKLVFMCSGGP